MAFPNAPKNAVSPYRSVLQMASGAFYGHLDVLGDDPADGQDRCENKPDFEGDGAADVAFFHVRKDNIGCLAMQPASGYEPSKTLISEKKS
jgi:hypothetical protein